MSFFGRKRSLSHHAVEEKRGGKPWRKKRELLTARGREKKARAALQGKRVEWAMGRRSRGEGVSL